MSNLVYTVCKVSLTVSSISISIRFVTLYSAMLFYAMKCSTLFNFIINNTITFIVSSHLLLSAPDLFTYTYTYTYIYIYYCCCCYSIVYSYCCSLLVFFKGGQAGKYLYLSLSLYLSLFLYLS